MCSEQRTFPWAGGAGVQGCRRERSGCSYSFLFPPRSGGGARKGYMGHLTRVANALMQNTEKGPNAEQLRQLLKGKSWGTQGVLGWATEVPHVLSLPVQSCLMSSRSSGRPSCRDPWRRPTRRIQWTW